MRDGSRQKYRADSLIYRRMYAMKGIAHYSMHIPMVSRPVFAEENIVHRSGSGNEQSPRGIRRPGR